MRSARGLDDAGRVANKPSIRSRRQIAESGCGDVHSQECAATTILMNASVSRSTRLRSTRANHTLRARR